MNLKNEMKHPLSSKSHLKLRTVRSKNGPFIFQIDTEHPVILTRCHTFHQTPVVSDLSNDKQIFSEGVFL